MNAASCIKCFECKGRGENAYSLPFRLTGESVYLVKMHWFRLNEHSHKWNDINSLSIQLYIFGLFFEWNMMITYIQHTAAFTEPRGMNYHRKHPNSEIVLLFWLWDGIAFMKLPRSIYPSKKPVSSTDFSHNAFNHPQKIHYPCIQLLQNMCVGVGRAGRRGRVSAWEESKVSKATDCSQVNCFLYESQMSLWIMNLDRSLFFYL